MSSRRLILAAATAVLLAVSACSLNTGSSGGGGLACRDVKLAYIGPLSGPNQTFGTTAYDGVKLSVKDFEQAHPGCAIAGVDAFDTQGDPGQVPALAQKALSDKQIVGVVGPGFSGEVKAALPILDEAGVPTITSSATNADLSKQGWKVFHRTVGNDDVETTGLTDYLVSTLKVKTVAVVDNGQAYGKGSADLFARKIERLGARVVVRDSIDASNQDYSSTVIALAAARADAVFCGCLYPEAGRIVKQLRSAGSAAAFVGPAGTYSPDFIKDAGASSAEGTYVSAASAPIGEFAGYDRFAAAWQKDYGTVPDVYSPEAYDAATAFLTAINDGQRTRAAINTWLDSADFNGLSGPIKFTAGGDVVRTKVAIYQVKAGQFHVVAQVPVSQS
ncbi:ABC transporter substrate-binding protein [Pseudonocardia acidicola]|uniref:Branched-chain amino acid ABC transporter substrate-binding protein n=1 Tax=Pseudonocardia acidicola TaxID=2724939 RepID=A0ABX1S7K3_9PSEU|nr:branched-chain amino acid ABC transporter substrate-binding protein [Pseudonocardia acidicola]